MRRPQFSVRAMLILMFGAACFFGGIHFERERCRRADEAMIDTVAPFPAGAFQWQEPSLPDAVNNEDDSSSPIFVWTMSETIVPKAPPK